MIPPRTVDHELQTMSGNNRHPSIETVARYLDDAMISEERNVLELHLNDCFRCRDELVNARGALRKLRRRRHMMVAAPIAVAACSVLLFQLGKGAWLAPSDEFRAGSSVAAIRAIEPGEGAVTTGDSVRFVWSVSGPEGASFVLTVTDSAGNRLYEISTEDTLVLVRQEDVSAGTGTFLWFVDALFEDGRSASTRIRRFRFR